MRKIYEEQNHHEPVSQGYQSLPYLLLKECEPLIRSSPFSYVCGRCGRCCINNQVRLNEYEVARLAIAKKITNKEFIDLYTQEDGREILRDSEGLCAFLVDKACSVYDDRPLACRIYPLCLNSRHKDQDFIRLLEPDPETKGRYGTVGTVNDYLNSQGAEEYISKLDTLSEFGFLSPMKVK